MTLAGGTRIGSYVVVDQLGAGGMGEVYRATDTNLKRAVALKVLPGTFAADPERLARFQREAEILAALNHPHIAAIYGLERSAGVIALVMELVDGLTLAERVATSPLPVDEALAIARQIAEALDAAHGRGIVHRDLKPANIKVRPDGTVKVLDFGLAKALDSAAAAPPTSASPTITSPAMMSAAGVLLGTAAYMSPEQARGRAVDKRSDIWAFGAVLYEMLTGRRAFEGEEIADVLAAVLTREPDWSRLPPTVRPGVATAVRRCLQKDPAQRLHDIADAWLAIDGAFDAPASVEVLNGGRPRRRASLAVAAVLASAVTGFAAWAYWPASRSPAPTRFEYTLPAGQQLATAQQRPVVAVFRDGSSFIYQTMSGLYQRPMAKLEASPVPGTTDIISAPVMSPDGRWIAYFSTSGHLKKMPVEGGSPVTLCATTLPFGASWTSDNTILFGQAAGIMQVSAEGGTPALVVPARGGEQIYGAELLPGGRAVLFSVAKSTRPNRWDEAQVVVEELSSHRRTIVVDAGSDPRFLKTGHVVYTLGGGIYGIRFDVARLQSIGGPVPLITGVQRSVGVRAAASHYAVADDGTLVYVAENTSASSLIWVNRDGSPGSSLTSIPPGPYEDPRLSPEGRRVVVTRAGDIWVYDLASGRSDRITDDGLSQMGVWDPTGSRIAYASARTGNMEAWVESADGSGEPRQLTRLGDQVHVDTWSSDGRILAVHHHPAEGPVPIYLLDMERPDATPVVFLPGSGNKESAAFSSDGEYVSYLSGESGQREIYVRPYRKPGVRVTASAGGGREPVWARNGELFYRSLGGEQMFSVRVKTTPTLSVGAPVPLFRGHYYIAPSGSPRAQYDVTADGKQLLMIAPSAAAGSTSQQRIVVVQHWPEEVRARFPAE